MPTPGLKRLKGKRIETGTLLGKSMPSDRQQQHAVAPILLFAILSAILLINFAAPIGAFLGLR